MMQSNVTSIRESVEACVNVIGRLDNEVHAWEEIFKDEAIEKADQLDNSNKQLPLKGLIVGLKDIFNFVGRAPGNGCQPTVKPLSIPKEEAAIVTRLQEAGAVILGTTKLTELCWYRPSDTCNPHHLTHTPGGSSSGSAAAVAAGMVPLAIGTQTNGSTIRPASFCGVYGFKPTYGLINCSGMTRISRSMDHPGILAQRPTDILKVFNVLTHYRSNNVHDWSLQSMNKSSLKSLKIGVLDISAVPSIEDEAIAVLNRYAYALKSIGHNVTMVKLPQNLLDIKSIYDSVFFPEVYSLLGYIVDRGEGNLIGKDIRSALEEGKTIKANVYFHGMQKKDELTYKVNKLFGGCDFLVLPSTLGPAPEGLENTGGPFMSTLSSFVGIPCASIPFGLSSEGLPLGIQIWARKYEDLTLLNALMQLPAELIHPQIYSGMQ
jgi:Asp-tRNAAsn/Glu-tRNAGln amidotransferase A subunit and related amidases